MQRRWERNEWEWSIGGTDTDIENAQSLGQKPLFIINPTAIGLWPNPALHDDRSMTRRPKHGISQDSATLLNCRHWSNGIVAYARFTSNQVFEVRTSYERALSMSLLHSRPVVLLDPENRSKLQCDLSYSCYPVKN